MNRLPLQLLFAACFLAESGAGLLAANADVASPPVSYQFVDALDQAPAQPNIVSALVAYQYSDTLAERPAQPNVVSSLVSYQFFEWPSPGNSTVHQSALVSFEFEPVSLAGIRLRPAPGAPMAVVLAFDIPTEAGESYVIEFTTTLSPPAWSVLRPIAGDGHLVTFLVEIPQDAPTRFFRVRRSGGE